MAAQAVLDKWINPVWLFEVKISSEALRQWLRLKRKPAHYCAVWKSCRQLLIIHRCELLPSSVWV